MKYREKIETRRGTIAGRNIRSLAFLGIFLIVGVCLIAGKILYERNIEVYTNYAYSDAHLIADSISGITPTKYLETQTKDAEYYDIRYTFMTAGIYQDEFRDFYLVVPTEDDLIYISEIYHNLPEGMEDTEVIKPFTVGQLIDTFGENNVRELIETNTAEAAKKPEFEQNAAHIAFNWIMLALITVVFAALSTISLELIDKDKR